MLLKLLARTALERAHGWAFMATPLLFGIQWMLRFIVKLILQAQTVLVSLYCLDNACNRLDPPVHLKFAKLAGGKRAVARIMIGETGIPPDSGVRRRRADRGGAGRAPDSLRGTIHVNQIRPGDQHFRCLALARVHVQLIFPGRSSGGRGAFIEDVDNVVMALLQLALRKKRQQGAHSRRDR